MSSYSYDRTAATNPNIQKLYKLTADLEKVRSKSKAAANSLKRREDGGYKTWDSLDSSEQAKIKKAVDELEKAVKDAGHASRVIWNLVE